MKAEYCFEYALLVDGVGNYRYELAGIWAFDPATLDLDCLYLPGYDDLEQRAMETVAGFVEFDIPVPRDILERFQTGMSSYVGDLSNIFETDEFDTLPELSRTMLKDQAAKEGRFFPWFFQPRKPRKFPTTADEIAEWIKPKDEPPP